MESVETTVDFKAILDEIDEIIDTAGGGGSPLNDWLETIEANFNKKCKSNSIKTVSDDGLNALGFAHECRSRKKLLHIELRGKKGVKVWSDKIVSTSHNNIKPTCETKNLNKSTGWERCIWKIYLTDG